MTWKLERAGRFAGVVARIAEIVVAVAAALNLVVLMLLVVDPDAFAVDADGYGATRALGGTGWNIGISGEVMDMSLRLQRGGGLDMAAAVTAALAAAVIYALLALVFHEAAGMCGELVEWLSRSGDDRSLHAPLASRLRRIGAALVATLVVTFVAESVALTVGVSASLTLGGTAVVVVFAGLCLLLGAVFDHVAVMQREMDGLV